MPRPLSPQPVFLAAASADYTAARAVAQHLTDAGWTCFFCDEALLRAGDRGYQERVDRELAQAKTLVVVAGQAERVEAEWVRHAWRGFAEKKAGPMVTVLAEELSADDLPRRLRQGACLRFPEELTGLEAALSGQAGPCPSRRQAAGVRIWSRAAVWVTMLNLAILGAVLWLLRARVFGPQESMIAGSEPRKGESQPVDRSSGPSGMQWQDVDFSLTNETGAAASEESSEKPRGIAEAGHGGKAAEASQQSGRIVESLGGEPRAGTVFRVLVSEDVQQRFACIPAGRFIMGSPATEAGRESDEAQREVEIAEAFWLACTECTVSLWREVMGGKPEGATGDHRPVISVSWEELTGENDGFFARLNARGLLPQGWEFRLPDEEQWEYACRAGTTTPFHFGEALNGEQANCDGSLPYGTDESGPYLRRTVPTGSYPPNAWGLHDMHGNAWEWCAGNVRRGGGWRFGAVQCRAANRESGGKAGDDTLGFRIAMVRKSGSP